MPDISTPDGMVRRMSGADLGRVLAWRNHPRVRALMYTQHEIALEEHTRWFERSNSDPNRHLLVYEEDGIPSGFVNFAIVSAERNALWGFYAAPEAPKGTGRRMGRAALAYGFDQAGFDKISGEALAHNEKSIRYHLSLGFMQEGELKRQLFDGGMCHDIVCLGLLESEWRRQQVNTSLDCA